MTNVTQIGPRKSMTKPEREMVQILSDRLPKEPGGGMVLAELLRLIASYMGSPSTLGFEAFAKSWLLQGNAKNEFACEQLCEVFGIGAPGAA